MFLKTNRFRINRCKRSSRRGAIAVLAAFCLVIAIAFLAFALDFGYIELTENQLQNATDSAALSAARKLPYGREASADAAKTWAGKHTAAGRKVRLVAEEDIEFGFWDEDTATFSVVHEQSDELLNAVKLTTRRHTDRGNALNLFFAPIIGTKDINLEVSAIAQFKDGACGGIMALEKIYLNDRQAGRASYTDSYNSNHGDYLYAGENGDVCTNGHLTLNGNSRVNGDARWWEEANSPKADESQVSGEFASFENPIDFPEVDPGDAATDNDNGSIAWSDHGTQPLKSDGSFELTYSGSTDKKKKKGGGATDPGESSLEPDSVTLSPGTYYFSKFCVGGNSVVRVTGPTYIYVEGDIDLRFGAIINETRKPINLQIYPMGLDTYFYLPFFGELHASIYSTKAHIYLDEKEQPVNLEFYGKMVGQAIRVWDTALHVDESLVFESLRGGGAQNGTSTGARLVQ
jgi:Flp pilus assembly protein TadG